LNGTARGSSQATASRNRPAHGQPTRSANSGARGRNSTRGGSNPKSSDMARTQSS
jgi:hypothetical protein